MSKLRVDELESLSTGKSITVDEIDSDVRLDLANPAKGAAMVARGVVAVDSIADLLALPEGQRKEGLRYRVKGYHAGSDVGGGEFYWVAEATGEADSGTVFADDGTGEWIRVINGPINPQMFGARGDGVTDDAAAIQAALDSGQSTIIFPTGEYLCDTPLTKTLSGGELNLIGDGLVKLYSSVPDPSIFLTINGTISAGSSLLSDVVSGSRVITSDVEVSPGDLIRIRSGEAWNPARNNNYKKAEFCRVSKVEGTAITLEWPLYDGYTAAANVVYKVSAPRVAIRDITFITDKAVGLDEAIEGINLRYCQDVKIDRVSVRNFTTTNLEIRDSFNVSVTQCDTYGEFFPGQGQGYGLLNTDCQNFLVYGGIYIAGRHGIATGGGSVVRNFIVDGATVSSEGSYGFDTHEGHDNVIVKNCDIRSGLSVFVKSAIIRDNSILGSLQVQPMKSGGIINISGNTVTDGTIQVGSYSDSGAVQTDLVSIDNNSVTTSVGFALRLSSSVQAADSWYIPLLRITNNVLRTTAPGQACCTFVGNTARVLIGGMSLLNNSFFSSDSLSFSINENQFSVVHCSSSGNTFETASAASENVRFTVGPAEPTEAIFYGNSFYGGTSGLFFNSYLGVLSLNDNVFKNCDYSFETKASPNWNKLWATNNIEIDVAHGWKSINQTSRIYSPSQNGLRQIVWAYSPPESGTWQRGSIVYNISPAASGHIGWSCITTGTPGVWKAFGTIAA